MTGKTFPMQSISVSDLASIISLFLDPSPVHTSLKVNDFIVLEEASCLRTSASTEMRESINKTVFDKRIIIGTIIS
jgi:hypothetical protein